jgi:hypothetical protein
MTDINKIGAQIESEMENIKKPLFSQTPYFARNSIINAWLYRQWDSYAEGYLKAGHALVDQVVRENGIDQDFLIYPIVFMYRQYLELRLKELLKSGSILLDLPLGKKEAWGHDILLLWKKTRPILERIWPKSEWYDLIEERIAELASADPDSMSFRYPDVPMDGLEPPQNNYINPVHLRDVMIGISHVLEGSSIGIGENLNAKNEMEAEFRHEMNENGASE